jgi:hypothetical protein
VERGGESGEGIEEERGEGRGERGEGQKKPTGLYIHLLDEVPSKPVALRVKLLISEAPIFFEAIIVDDGNRGRSFGHPRFKNSVERSLRVETSGFFESGPLAEDLEFDFRRLEGNIENIWKLLRNSGI